MKTFSPENAIHTGLAILLAVCVLLYVLRAYPCDIHIRRAVKGIESSDDALVDVLESAERFFRHLDMYTQIPHSPALDEMVVKIVIELLSILELATKRVTQGRLSESILVDLLPSSMQCSEICKE